MWCSRPRTSRRRYFPMLTGPVTSSPAAKVQFASPSPVPNSTEVLRDPVGAAALFAAWSGDPAVVVASPPGAGKTRLVVQLAEQLNRRAGLGVAIATQTRAQALEVTGRTARSEERRVGKE